MKKEDKEEKCIWIIRYADGTLASFYGDKHGAEVEAKKKKDLYGGKYIVI